MTKSVLNRDCRSWYEDNSIGGKPVAVWNGTTLHHIETVKDIYHEDQDIQYFDNLFNYLGNGSTKLETSSDVHLSTYIRMKDGSEIVGSMFVYAIAEPHLTTYSMTAADADPGEIPAPAT